MTRPQRFQIRVGQREHEVCVDPGPPRRVFVDDMEHRLVQTPAGPILVRGPHDGPQFNVVLDHPRRPSQASVRGLRFEVSARTAEAAALAEALLAGSEGAGGGQLVAPMPGRVIKVLVEVGEVIEQGTPVIIVEAMKMENELHAPSAGVVRSISVGEGDVVETGAILCVIQAPDDEPHDS